MSACVRGPIAVNQRFGTLVVREILTASEAGRGPNAGTFCRVRCDCRMYKLVRASHLRLGRIRSCRNHMIPCELCGNPVRIGDGCLTKHLRICVVATPEQRRAWGRNRRWPEWASTEGKALRALALARRRAAA